MNFLHKLRKFFSKIPIFKKLYIKLLELKEVFLIWHNYVYPIYKFRLLNPKSAFLVFTPEHSNLGDHAIALAEKNFLKELSISYFEITGKILAELDKAGYLHCMNGALILVNGGGNLGTLWPEVEQLHRNIILNNPKSSIIIFPNTIYYENSFNGNQEFENSKKIYNNHKNLFFFAREKTSFDIMKSAYNNVKISPDVVLSINESLLSNTRKGCLICLRNDREKTLTLNQYDLLIKQVHCLFENNYQYTDMHAKKNVPISEREYELSKKFNEFRSAELVITDRLHGMIFCAITGTPCIVINSKSHKVKGCYEWIKDLEYIQFADNIEQIPELYNSIPKKVFTYDNKKFEPMFNQLKNDIANCANK